MEIAIAEAGHGCKPHDALGIYVGESGLLAKACGGVRLCFGAASRRTPEHVEAIMQYINHPSRFEKAVLLHDHGQTAEAMVLLNLVKARLP